MKKSRSRFVVIDLSQYHVDSIASVLFGYAVWVLLSMNSSATINAFKYI